MKEHGPSTHPLIEKFPGVEAGESLDTDVERQVQATFEELQIKPEVQRLVNRFLALLRGRHQPSYEDSLQVGLLGRQIARHENLDEATAFISGLLHDVGKTLVPRETLEKKVGWTDEDREKMDAHVIHGLELTKDLQLGIVPDIIARSHQFQERKVPTTAPEYSGDWDEDTKALIERSARLLALADVYDALHRPNDRYAKDRALTGEEIKEKMFKLNPDQTELIESLYDSEEKIFTTEDNDAMPLAA